MPEQARPPTARPYVIINAAMAIDGKIALENGKQTKLSSDEDFRRVYRMRNSCDAILVGINTVLNDDPKLTVKPEYLDPGEPVRNVPASFTEHGQEIVDMQTHDAFVALRVRRVK